MKPVLDVIREADNTFTPVLSILDPFVSARYRNAAGCFVDMLTPNRGSHEHQGKTVRMKELSGSRAEPFRHLDFLIHEPERSLLLYRGGVPVNVPRAERYAIHKLILAIEREDQTKAYKDIVQAGTLIEALVTSLPKLLPSLGRRGRSGETKSIMGWPGYRRKRRSGSRASSIAGDRPGVESARCGLSRPIG
jgi:hypothetical protein